MRSKDKPRYDREPFDRKRKASLKRHVRRQDEKHLVRELRNSGLVPVA